MYLLMFDIDGTLTQTSSVDSECFIQAISEELGLTRVNSDWAQYRHVTDSGIAAEIIESTFKRPPARDELDRIHNRFAGLLKNRFAADPCLCAEIPGAARLLFLLKSRCDITVALATGGWSQTAQLKLKCAGLHLDHVAFASASDSHSRREIMRTAHDRAASQHAIQKFKSVVYVGDAIWDYHACQTLGIPLIGIGIGPRAAKLKAAGVPYLIGDYSEPHEFFELLAAAQSTGPAGSR